MPRIIFPMPLALAVAVVTAIVFGAIVHDCLGIPRVTIRLDSLAGVALIGSALAARSMRKRNE